MVKESSTKRRNRLAAGKCCWHCRYYVRPVECFQLDGPLGNVCTVERDSGSYATPDSLNSGDKLTDPDFYCNRFGMDLPPLTDGQDSLEKKPPTFSNSAMLTPSEQEQLRKNSREASKVIQKRLKNRGR